ncbi:MAG: phosphatase PAP2 family protein [Parvularculaceae bacterium]
MGVRPFFPVLCLLLSSLGACASLENGPYWGQDAAASPGWSRIRHAAAKAATDPLTWAPALSAAALQIGDADDEIADWANRHTPLFGSRETAADASDWLRGASVALYLGTGLAAPVGDDADWFDAKARGFAVGAGAIAATSASTWLLKEVSDRPRPLGQNDNSFPSGHTSLAAVSARLTHHTLGYYGLSRSARTASDVGLAGLALMTGWARIEAGEHHPADALAGAALGNFFAVFATEAFLAPVAGDNAALGVSPYGDGWTLHVFLAF